jgi:hypothetical protein
MPDTSQDPAAVVVYLDDWTAKLSKMVGTRTISTATVTASNGATVSSVTPAPTGVMFKLNVAGVASPPALVTTTTTATLDNGDVDVAHHTIQVTST